MPGSGTDESDPSNNQAFLLILLCTDGLVQKPFEMLQHPNADPQMLPAKPLVAVVAPARWHARTPFLGKNDYIPSRARVTAPSGTKRWRLPTVRADKCRCKSRSFLPRMKEVCAATFFVTRIRTGLSHAGAQPRPSPRTSFMQGTGKADSQ